MGRGSFVKTISKKMKWILSSVMFIVLFGRANDSTYVRKITDTLSSEHFLGRGYVNDGMGKAARFIEDEMKQQGLSVQAQPLRYPVNVFSGKMKLSIDSTILRPGVDFIVAPESRGRRANGPLVKDDGVTWMNLHEKVIIKLVDKLTWSVAQVQAGYTLFQVLKTAVKEPSKFSCDIDADFKKSFACENVIGTVKGTVKPDSFIVFTAHYDHLGAMGRDVYFPGANDNAGGVALLLSLAGYYQKNPSPYSMMFIAFAGEEAGLVGSEYFVNHPLTDLKKIRFLLNLDLMGNGEEGITVVNATEFPREFKMMQQINETKHLLAAVNSRGKAHNSDHYWFTEKGVPSFFIYTLGSRKAYHDVDDVTATVPWFEINDLETLITSFVSRLAEN